MNSLEKKIYKASQRASGPLTQKEIEQLVDPPSGRELTSSINALLTRGSLQPMQKPDGTVLFRFVSKEEHGRTAGMDQDEGMIFRAIQESATEGIWLQSIRMKTNLHQSVINRCIKSLEQRRMIKTVKSVKNPTRKIFMLAGLEPSVDVTGGPWYTDNEFDSEFINTLRSNIFNFISSKSLPQDPDKLHPSTLAKNYPSIPVILKWLKKSRITSADLSEEHIEQLLDTLVYDGEVERIAFCPAVESSSESSSDDSSSSSSSSSSASSGDGEDASDSDLKAKVKRKKAQKGKKSKKQKTAKKEESSSDEDDKVKKSGSGSDSGSSSDNKRPKKRSKSSASSSKKKSVKKDSDGSSSDSSSGSSAAQRRRKRDKKRRSRSESSNAQSQPAFVYRAVKLERRNNDWADSPCGKCPVFDFCASGGPVNPSSCRYYDDWLLRGYQENMDDLVENPSVDW